MGNETTAIGVVAIGRNEGERLKRCLRSVPSGVPIVYVDSGSSDDSVAFARSVGAQVVELDMARPFTAARARNEGYARLVETAPAADYIQFVDGDCELERGWLEAAEAFLAARSDVAVVCGRRRERFPEASFYNRLCDDEWDTPLGESRACGGDALFRRAALAQVNGYDPAMVAGEEPELCQRLRAAGWRVWRLDAPMTIHDAAMHRPRQWWLRAVRSGFGYAQAWSKTAGSGAKAIYGREVGSALFWTCGVTAAAVALALLVGAAGLILAPLVWCIQLWRLSRRSGLRKAAHLLVGKVAETLGILRFVGAMIRGRKQGAIFYK